MSEPSSQFAAWRQLFRIANVFTAVSNVLAGAMLSDGDWLPAAPLLLLIGSSALLYTAGMVLNDVFDSDLDAEERPERPIPSGRIDRQLAAFVGWALLAGGILCSAWASYELGSIAAVTIAASLAVTIVMYNGGLKAIWAGPLAMGWCRALNVLLGASLAGNEISAAAWLFAGAIGVYTIGLTVLARNEVGDTERLQVRTSGLLLLAAFVLLFLVSFLRSPGDHDIGWYWILAWGSVLELAGIAYFAAVRSDTPQGVQLGVKRLILLFIVIDALICLLAGGWAPAGIVLLLLVPTLLLSRTHAMT
ncbi:UbiA family prenyltransferase [Adhaeretor mobilis]|uniref:Prenyltransferase n=1 Tax=Adhaeretor mobilis TaxID=1930276 RepID=A0A517MXP9_9BACT|nr:UbiA family prenyltransferase [Adhaeretor mobilis]QDS99654.1 prenyltransferase [Adhaeretor mobilis]